MSTIEKLEKLLIAEKESGELKLQELENKMLTAENDFKSKIMETEAKGKSFEASLELSQKEVSEL